MSVSGPSGAGQVGHPGQVSGSSGSSGSAPSHDDVVEDIQIAAKPAATGVILGRRLYDELAVTVYVNCNALPGSRYYDTICPTVCNILNAYNITDLRYSWVSRLGNWY